MPNTRPNRAFSRPARAFSRLATLLLGLSLLTAGTAGAASSPEPERAVQQLNEWRALVGVMPVSHDPLQTEGCRAHAEYYRQTGQTGHSEDPSHPAYTEAGAQAAASSVLSYGGGADGPYLWENAVYHRTGLLNPRLETTGFWAEHELGCMGVFGTSDDRTAPAMTIHPYPYDGQVGVETTFGCNERPNPCTNVPGNSGQEPTGFIPSVQFNGPWRYIDGPRVSAAQLVPDGGAPLAITVEDEDSGLGAFLDRGFDLIPHQPLSEGTWYTASAEGELLTEYEGGEEGGEGKGGTPFSISWRFQTRVTPVPPGDPGLRLAFVRGRPRVVSRSSAPVELTVRQRRRVRRLTLPLPAAANGLHVATAPVRLRAASWRVCAVQPADPAANLRGERACQQGRPLRLRVTVLYAGSRLVRLRIKAPPDARGRRAIVSLLSRRGALLDRARVVLRRKSRLDLRAARGRRALLRVRVRPFRQRGIPRRVRPVRMRLRCAARRSIATSLPESPWPRLTRRPVDRSNGSFAHRSGVKVVDEAVHLCRGGEQRGASDGLYVLRQRGGGVGDGEQVDGRRARRQHATELLVAVGGHRAIGVMDDEDALGPHRAGGRE